MRRNVYLNEKTFLLLLFLQAISIKKAFNSYFCCFSLSYFGVLLYFCTGIGKKISKMNRRKMKIGSLMALKASLLVMVFSMGVIAPAIAQNNQNRKPRKKLKELLMMADSLRLQLRQSADKGRMLQWGDSLLMAELGKSKMSEKKKQRFMKHYVLYVKKLSPLGWLN